jgi:hypothetical protein
MQRELSEQTKQEMRAGVIALEKFELAVRIKYFSDRFRGRLPDGVNVFHTSRHNSVDGWIIESVVMTDGGETTIRSKPEEFPSEELRATLALLTG